MKNRFVLISRWRLDCDIGRAWQLICALRHWPQWWPQVKAVRLADESCGDKPRVGSSAWIDWKTRLGYALRLRVTTTRVQAPFELEGTADGDLNGHGLWLLEPHGSTGVTITYRWDVSLNRSWMRWSSPLLRPVFAWNHGEVMGAGARAMAAELGCRLLHYQDYQFVPGESSEDPKRRPWGVPLALRASSQRRGGVMRLRV